MSNTVEQARRKLKEYISRECSLGITSEVSDLIESYAAAVRADERAKMEAEIARLRRLNRFHRAQ